ncbi:MAG: response regulator [Acidobacteriia bacterium]|nr:response regulator [Terriglobia bacterium]
MSRVLLVDASPHAQRMGERILTDEGFEVVTVSTAESALIRIEDVDPDVVIADTGLPGRNGFDICHYLKMSPRHGHVRVVLSTGALDVSDEDQQRRVGADGTLRKPFEASVLLDAVRPLAEAAERARAEAVSANGGPRPRAKFEPVAPFVAVVDTEQVRAAVTVALDAAMAGMVDEISRRVVAALADSRPRPESSDAAAAGAPRVPQESVRLLPLQAALPMADRAPSADRVPTADPVRRPNPLKARSRSILGLDVNAPDSRDSH